MLLDLCLTKSYRTQMSHFAAQDGVAKTNGNQTHQDVQPFKVLQYDGFRP